MLLAIDIGNSNIVFGLFDKDRLVDSFRIETEKDKREEYYRQKISDKQVSTVDGVVIGSVVPELDNIFTSVIAELFHTKPLFISTELDTGIINLTRTPSELGADRLADAVAAIALYQGNRIIVDLGTASKFEAVSEKNEYLGGAIGPGVGSSFSSLIKAASKLSEVKLSPPKKVVGGFVTEEHLNSGFVYGFAGMVDGMIFRMKEELGWDSPAIILTGGFTDLISPHLQTKVVINKNLTLEGLRILWGRNK
jgi:type III pantothenate kinase